MDVQFQVIYLVLVDLLVLLLPKMVLLEDSVNYVVSHILKVYLLIIQIVIFQELVQFFRKLENVLAFVEYLFLDEQVNQVQFLAKSSYA